MASPDERTLVLCEWPVTVYVPADLGHDVATELTEEAESQLGVYVTELEALLRRRVPQVRVEVG